MDRHGAGNERRTGPGRPVGCDVLVELDADWPAPRRPDQDEPVSREAGDEDLPAVRGTPTGGPSGPVEPGAAMADDAEMPVRRTLGRIGAGPADGPPDPASDRSLGIGAVSEPTPGPWPEPDVVDEHAAGVPPPRVPPPPAHVVADGPFEGHARRPRAVRAANAIVVYDGDKLRDVYDLLESLGARPERARLSGPTRFEGWDLPPKLLVVDAQDAVSIDWPKNVADVGVVRIAVASAASAVLGKILRSQGFHYLVRRPVHPHALAVLLRHALHRGHDRRRQPRSPLGIDARLSTGAFRWPGACTVLELSSMACRIVTREDVPLLTPVRLRIGRSASGTRAIVLRSRVVRRRRDERTGEWVLALRFVDVPPEQRGRLDDLLARTAVGPSAGPAGRPRRSAWRRLLRATGMPGPVPAPIAAPDAGHATPAPGPAPEGSLAPCPDPPPERRRARRAALHGEVLALGEGGEGVGAVLAGRDLSTRGLRVEPHPELEVGQKLVVAFHDSLSGDALEIGAEVVRDDGDRGLGIRFVEMAPETAVRIEQLVEALPSVESLLPDAGPLVTARMRRVPVDPGATPASRPAPGPSSHEPSAPPGPPAAMPPRAEPSRPPWAAAPPPQCPPEVTPPAAPDPAQTDAPRAAPAPPAPQVEPVPPAAATRSDADSSAPGGRAPDDGAAGPGDAANRRRSLRRIRRRRGR